MDREQLDGWCERGILGGVLVVLVFGALATGAVRPQDFLVIQWLTVAILCLWILRFWLNPDHRLLWPPLSWAVLLFLLYAVGRYLKADIEYVARMELIKVLIYGILFFAILNNLHRQESTQIIGLSLLVLGTVVSLYAIYQLLTDSNHVWHFTRPAEYRTRGSGTFICPDHLAGFLGLLLPLSLTYTMTGRFKNLTKVLAGYAGLVIFIGILCTFSRGGWIATGASLAVLFFWLIRKRDYRLQSLILLAALLAIAAIFFYTVKLAQNRPGPANAAAAQRESVRFKLWPPAVRVWQDHLWWGAGPAHFDYRFRQYRPADPELQVRPGRVHNDYLNTLADWGLTGAILVASAWALFFWEVFRTWKFVQRGQNDLASKRSNKSSFVMGGALGLMAILVHSIFDFNMHVPANAVLTVTLLALVSGHFRFATDRYWLSLRWPLRSLVTVVLLAGLVYLGGQSWLNSTERRWLLEAGRIQKNPPEQLASLKKAFAADGKNFDTANQIGEKLRLLSWQGNDGYTNLAKEAMEWFKRAMDLNRHDAYSRIRYGMCLHWLEQHIDAEPHFKRASELDPNGSDTVAHVGWHYVQLEDYAAAKKWFERSLQLRSTNNPMASAYLDIVERRLAEPPSPRIERH